MAIPRPASPGRAGAFVLPCPRPCRPAALRASSALARPTGLLGVETAWRRTRLCPLTLPESLQSPAGSPAALHLPAGPRPRPPPIDLSFNPVEPARGWAGAWARPGPSSRNAPECAGMREPCGGWRRQADCTRRGASQQGRPTAFLPALVYEPAPARPAEGRLPAGHYLVACHEVCPRWRLSPFKSQTRCAYCLNLRDER